MRTWEVIQNPKYMDFAVRLGRETAQVAKALGCKLEPVFGLTAEDFLNPEDEELKKLLLSVMSDVGKEMRTCVLQDLLKDRITEISYLNGLVVGKGREVDVPTPVNEAVTSVIAQIERGQLRMGLANLDALDNTIAQVTHS